MESITVECVVYGKGIVLRKRKEAKETRMSYLGTHRERRRKIVTI
jgi:hypothetical protein